MSFPSDFDPTFVNSAPAFESGGFASTIASFLFLEDFLNRGLRENENRFNSPEREKRETEMLYREDPRPSFTVDPNKLDLREFRKPNVPVDSREDIERDKFLKSMYSPLT